MPSSNSNSVAISDVFSALAGTWVTGQVLNDIITTMKRDNSWVTKLDDTRMYRVRKVKFLDQEKVVSSTMATSVVEVL